MASKTQVSSCSFHQDCLKDDVLAEPPKTTTYFGIEVAGSECITSGYSFFVRDLTARQLLELMISPNNRSPVVETSPSQCDGILLHANSTASRSVGEPPSKAFSKSRR